jgi:alkylhydroperoxidase family enzyme
VPRITPLDPADSEGPTREVFEQFLKERGNIPNMMRTMGHRPEYLRTMVAHMRTVMNTGTVPRLLKELVSVRVSRINLCDY